MKLWLLRPVELPEDQNPWEPWYDKAFGFVVRARTEMEARKLASKQAGGENHDNCDVNPWLHKKYSTCEPLTAEGDAEVVMVDFHSA